MQKRPIVLVEDNPNDIELTLRALERNGIANKIIVAQDGEEALDLLCSCGNPGAELSTAPQLILLDLKLPKVDGVDILKRIRTEERLRGVPVVMLTSSQEEQDLLKCYASGANSYIRKPVDFAAFVDAIRQIGMYWLLLNEVSQPVEVSA